MVRPYEPLYTVKEAAKILKTNPTFVYGLINNKQLPGLRLGAIKIRGSDLERFIESQIPESQKNGGEEHETCKSV